MTAKRLFLGLILSLCCSMLFTPFSSVVKRKFSVTVSSEFHLTENEQFEEDETTFKQRSIFIVALALLIFTQFFVLLLSNVFLLINGPYFSILRVIPLNLLNLPPPVFIKTLR